MKVELDLSNYATKANWKATAGVDTSKFAKKVDLKSNVDKLDIDKLDVDKLVPVPTDFSKLSNVVKNDIVKKRCI